MSVQGVTAVIPAVQPRVEAWKFENGKEVKVEPNGLTGRVKTADPVLRTAVRNAHKVDSFLKDAFGRDGWDGKGSPLKIVVHAPDDDGKAMNNAYWDNNRGKIYLGDGDGKILAPLGNSLDVLAHEATHALVDSEVNLRYSGQQGAINESWADVMGALADPHDWKIGEDVFTPSKRGDAIRDLAKPRFGHTQSVPAGAEVDVHDLSGIPSLAAIKVSDALGRAQMGKIWYNALTEHLDSRSGFSGAARATLKATAQLYGGTTSKEYAAVTDAWRAVGVNPRMPKSFTVPKAK